MTISYALSAGLAKETIFKRGDFNTITSLYTQMLGHSIVRDCAPVITEETLMFRLFKSSKDPIFLYQIAITRDLKNKRYVYEIIDATGKQICQGSKLSPLITKFKYHLGEKHHISAWKKPKRATDR